MYQILYSEGCLTEFEPVEMTNVKSNKLGNFYLLSWTEQHFFPHFQKQSKTKLIHSPYFVRSRDFVGLSDDSWIVNINIDIHKNKADKIFISSVEGTTDLYYMQMHLLTYVEEIVTNCYFNYILVQM